MNRKITLAAYFKEWMETFKKPAISPVTYIKYENTHKHILTYFGATNLDQLDRQTYQQALNQFAKTHAKRTTAGFHKQIRAAVLDILEEGTLNTDFTRKAIVLVARKRKQR